MKSTSRSILLFIFFLSVLATSAQPVKQLKKVLELKIPREGGANGATVAWHPAFKKYYAAMAGNVSFFIGVYDVNGKRLNAADQEALFDVRGLWYNPNTKTLQMNGYNDFGWAEYKLDGKGFPTGIKNLYEEMHQPDEQSVGSFNPKEKLVYFFNGEGNLDKYSYADGDFISSIELHLGKTSKDEEDYSDNYDVLQDYNNTTAVFTGIAKGEIGLLNHTNKEIELYDLKTGYITRKFTLPENAPVNSFLNFAYCNGVYWLFDKEHRIWMGYK